MFPLLLCAVTLAAAPLVDVVLRGRRGLEAFADGGVVSCITGIVLVLVLPEGMAVLGPLAVLALLLGVLGGLAVHQLSAHGAAAVALTVSALLLHAMIDGAGLAAGEHALAGAIVLHNLPIGLAVWRLTRERWSQLHAAGLLAAMVGCTAGGWAVLQPFSELADESVLHAIQCGLAGALLHPLFHLGHRKGPRRAASLGGVVGVALLLPFAGRLLLLQARDLVTLSVAMLAIAGLLWLGRDRHEHD